MEIMKRRLANDSFVDINDYGIYDYFDYCDNVYYSKLIAVIRDDQYVISTGHSDKCDHLIMHHNIERQIGKYDCFLGSSGDELNIFAKTSLTINQISVLIAVLNELKSYYLETGIDKDIRLMGTVFGDKFNSLKKCKDIDTIIYELTEMIKQKQGTNFVLDDYIENNDSLIKDGNNTRKMGFAKVWLLGILVLVISVIMLVVGIFLIY